MKFVIVLCVALLGKVHGDAKTCVAADCLIDSNCRCSQTVGPLSTEETPQLIVLAFVDSATADLYENRWSPLVEPRKNPDGNFIGATFYVPHEYSDYQIVHDLAANGFEIGVHSVTNNAHISYWKEATEALLEKEFGDQRKIISKFANIPEEYITGTMTPQLQLTGDSSIDAFVAQGFLYDNSWASKDKLFPYTLDYASSQSCDISANCPKESHAGFWISPIIDLTADDGDVCATVAGCFRTRNNQTAAEITTWLVDQVLQVKNENRAPLTIVIETDNLFTSVSESWTGVNDALDKLQEDEDIFFVSQSRVIEWIKNPVPLSEFTTGAVAVESGCQKETCKLSTTTGEIRYMVSCVPCPKNYPWLDNPNGS